MVWRHFQLAAPPSLQATFQSDLPAYTMAAATPGTLCIDPIGLAFLRVGMSSRELSLRILRCCIILTNIIVDCKKNFQHHSVTEKAKKKTSKGGLLWSKSGIWWQNTIIIIIIIYTFKKTYFLSKMTSMCEQILYRYNPITANCSTDLTLWQQLRLFS